MADDMKDQYRMEEAAFDALVEARRGDSYPGDYSFLYGDLIEREVKVILTALAPILAERDRETAREAWDRGSEHTEGRGGYYCPDDNPYEEEITDGR